MITKCVICKTETKNGACPRCDAGNKKDSGTQIKLDCQVCGGKRGTAREIRHAGRNEGWYCYDCYQEYQRRRYHSIPHTYDTKAEAAYYRALEDHYLKPLFYQQPPNYELLEQKRFAVTHAMKKADIM